MSRHLPAFTLALLLTAAAVVFAAGWRLSRHEEVVRNARDRSALMAFGEQAGGELHRLELAYEKRLRQTAALVEINNESNTRRICDEVAGIARCSFLSPPGRGKADTQIEIDYWNDVVFLPMPTFRKASLAMDRSVVALPYEEMLGQANTDFGWVDEPGKPLFFWHRRAADGVVVFTLHVPAVVAAINAELRSLSADYQRATMGGLDRWIGPGGVTVVSGQEVGRPADFVLPLHSRFGTWQMESWDPQMTVVTMQPLGVILSAMGSLALVLAGLGAFVHQRRALHLAAQRVSFVNSVSHELRTPLTNMLLNLDVAADVIEPENTEANKRLGLVREEGGRLGRLIENVLTFSRAEQGKLNLQPRLCRVSEVITRIVDQFRPLLERKGIELTLECASGEPMKFDPDALAQILANLLSNLEKYAPGASAVLRYEMMQKSANIRLSDNGPGIPASDAERIFLPFERLDTSLTQGTTGTGLGLSIARDLAQRMGGTLKLVSSDKGAVFELNLPAS